MTPPPPKPLLGLYAVADHVGNLKAYTVAATEEGSQFAWAAENTPSRHLGETMWAEAYQRGYRIVPVVLLPATTPKPEYQGHVAGLEARIKELEAELAQCAEQARVAAIRKPV